MKELQEFKQELIHNELSKATISRYMTDINQFIDKATISSKDDINKSKLLEYKGVPPTFRKFCTLSYIFI